MYGWIWRHLPGPTAVRIVFAVGLALALVFVLFRWVFPWVEGGLPIGDVTIETAPQRFVHRVFHSWG